MLLIVYIHDYLLTYRLFLDMIFLGPKLMPLPILKNYHDLRNLLKINRLYLLDRHQFMDLIPLINHSIDRGCLQLS
jgi:hypothetical protein